MLNKKEYHQELNRLGYKLKVADERISYNAYTKLAREI